MLRGRFWKSFARRQVNRLVRYLPTRKVLATVFCVMALLMLIVAFYISPVFCYSQEDAESAIRSAEDDVLKCYKAIFDAEKAGADVTGLLEVLNEAGWFLSEAKLAYTNEDFDSAYEYAVNCSQKLEGIASQANSLRLEAERAGYMDFLVNYVVSAVGSLAVVVVGYAVWVFFKGGKKPWRVHMVENY